MDISDTLQVKRLSEQAVLPSRAHPDDAGLDLFVSEDAVILSGERKTLRTGIALAIPSGHVGLIWDRSGLSAKQGLKTLGGVIDAGYRGEVLVTLQNLGDAPYALRTGDKVAQMLIQKVELPAVREVDELDDTDRGTKSFGSTGR